MKPTKIILLAMLLALCGCQNRDLCVFNLHLDYYYSGSDQQRGGDIEQHVDIIEQYIYNDKNILVQAVRLDKANTGAAFDQILNLPVGKYTLVAWGGRHEKQTELTGVTIGTSRIDDGLVTNIARSATYPGYYDNTDMLYFSTQTFTIGDADQDDEADDGVKHITCGMSERYAELIVHIRGLNYIGGRSTQLYMQLEGIPSVYDFKDTTLPAPLVNHRATADTNFDNQVNATFETFRYRGDTHPLLSLYDADGKELMRRIDLKQWFDAQGWQIDKLTTQHFELDIKIKGNTIIVAETTIVDWELGW